MQRKIITSLFVLFICCFCFVNKGLADSESSDPLYTLKSKFILGGNFYSWDQIENFFQSIENTEYYIFEKDDRKVIVCTWPTGNTEQQVKSVMWVVDNYGDPILINRASYRNLKNLQNTLKQGWSKQEGNRKALELIDEL